MAKVINRGLFISSLLLIIYAWSMYYIKNWIICLAISCSAVVLLYAVISSIMNKYDTKKHSKKQHKKLISQLSVRLINEIEVSKLIIPAIPCHYILSEQTSKKFKLTKNDKTTVVYCIFQYKEVEIDQFLEVLRDCILNNFKLLVLTIKCNAKTIATVRGSYKNVEIAQINEVFNMLDSADSLPELHSNATVKKNYKLLFAGALSRKQGNSYLVSGILVILSGFISFFPIYSQIMGTILVCLGLYSSFNKTFNTNFNNKLL